MEINSKHLTPFCFGDNLVRVVEDDNGEPWFVAKDVALALDYEWNGKARIAHVPEEWRGVTSVVTPSGIQEMLTLSEPGLYFFLGRSDKPKALPFQKWLAGEVLPTLRKTGRYEMRGRSEAVTSYALPEEMLKLSLNLKPAMRQRLWRDSLDTVRLDGGGFEAACQCFAGLCAMMAQKRQLPDSPGLIYCFMNECLESVKGVNTPGYRIYDFFRVWWDENCEGEMPGRKSFGDYLQTRFKSYKSNVMVYRNCRIRSC